MATIAMIIGVLASGCAFASGFAFWLFQKEAVAAMNDEDKQRALMVWPLAVPKLFSNLGDAERSAAVKANKACVAFFTSSSIAVWALMTATDGPLSTAFFYTIVASLIVLPLLRFSR